MQKLGKSGSCKNLISQQEDVGGNIKTIAVSPSKKDKSFKGILNLIRGGYFMYVGLGERLKITLNRKIKGTN